MRNTACRRRSRKPATGSPIPAVYQLMNTISPRKFRRQGDQCEIVTGNMTRPTSPPSGRRRRNRGFRPKIVTIGKALLFRR